MAAFERVVYLRGHARTAGVAYLIIIICGLFAEFGVRGNLYVVGDAAKTFENVVENSVLFRAGVAADLMMLIADVVVAWALFVLLSNRDRSLALLATLSRGIQAAVIAAGLIQLSVLVDSFTVGFGIGELQHTIKYHETAYLIGLVFFGITCFALGRLLLKHAIAHKALGYLLILAGAGYWVDSFGQLVTREYPESLSMAVLLPAFIGEFWFCGWLLWLGFGKQDLTRFEKIPEAETSGRV